MADETPPTADPPSTDGGFDPDGDHETDDGDHTSDETPADDEDHTTDDEAPADATGRREVVVPMRLYKTVTVFSTLFAMLGVIAGFVLLDAATDRASAPVAEVDYPVAVLGVACIVGGAAVYAYGTRFRTAGMGNAKDDDGEASNDG